MSIGLSQEITMFLPITLVVLVIGLDLGVQLIGYALGTPTTK